MALGLSPLIGDALLSLLNLNWPDMRPRVERAAKRVAEVLRPEPPFELHTTDGQVISGLVVLDRGRALLFLGIRQIPTSSSSSSARRPPDPRYDAASYEAPRERTYDEGLLWPRPYGR